MQKNISLVKPAEAKRCLFHAHC